MGPAQHSFEGSGNLRRCARCRVYQWKRPKGGAVYSGNVNGPWSLTLPTECTLSVDAGLYAGKSDWLGLDTVLVDVETTGLEHGIDRIIELAAVRGKYDGTDFVIEDVFAHVLDPGVPISEDVTRITGLRSTDVRGMPTFAEVGEEFLRFFGGCRYAIAYNAPFDQKFIVAECVRVGMAPPRCMTERSGAMIDPLVWGRWKARGYGKGANKLGPMAARLRLEVPENLHRADVDAILTGRVLGALAHHLPRKLVDVLDLQTVLRSEQEADYHQYRMRKRAEEALAKETAS
jgi:DNA polymerase-3 subunit epsilon